MQVKFFNKGVKDMNAITYHTYVTLQDILAISGFTMGDTFEVKFDELNDKKRIIITKRRLND